MDETTRLSTETWSSKGPSRVLSVSSAGPEPDLDLVAVPALTRVAAGNPQSRPTEIRAREGGVHHLGHADRLWIGCGRVVSTGFGSTPTS